MKRREFVVLSAVAPLIAAYPRTLAALPETRAGWREYELHYEVEMGGLDAPGTLWLPVPQEEPEYQRVLELSWHGDAREVALHLDPRYRAPIVAARWDAGASSHRLELRSRVSVRDRRMLNASVPLDPAHQALYLQPTATMPTDGIVASTAASITEGIELPEQRARAIYDWIVTNTFRDPKVRGCGTGDIRTMLETGYLGGKCADINSLFVGLARAAGLPAREVYGVRAGESAQFACLGKTGGDVSGAQHCRAEFFTAQHGWVPVDPADVRKVVLEEKLALDDARVAALRERLFGYWEMNWVAFNSARDFELAPAARTPVPYLMYPYAEFGDVSRDGRDPAAFSYRISSTERRA